MRDRAARLEKVMEDTSRQSNGNGIDVIDMVESGEQDETGVKTQNNEISKSTVAIDTTAENANLSTFTNLHETVGDFNDKHNNVSQYTNQPNESEVAIDERRDYTEEQCLPEYNRLCKPVLIEWGKTDNGSPISIQTSSIINAYDEIISWKNNVFLLPYGKIGREFIDQLSMHINQWNNKSDKQHIALKAFFVLLAVGLQKPGPKSKAKDHKEFFKKRLASWKSGEIDKLLHEGRVIQSRIGKGRKSEPQNKAKIFAKLVMEGQIN